MSGKVYISIYLESEAVELQTLIGFRNLLPRDAVSSEGKVFVGSTNQTHHTNGGQSWRLMLNTPTVSVTLSDVSVENEETNVTYTVRVTVHIGVLIRIFFMHTLEVSMHVTVYVTFVSSFSTVSWLNLS
ncbi:PREDICTED: uncharacterized protein LOC104814237 isoform X4 [Tarenaya hassleriana]|uniref:uncharacterized protein LOC104814237 isoform X4 n=1 Tax=Tarenaya hassleriana TaxID=28532 RepID=UPI00053C5F32|nr:PREDICTED: uncharacterized protein LOC104814237 isoform X4 [Tarenaya hassleriana]